MSSFNKASSVETFKFGLRTLMVLQGTEGPKHDPYGFIEYRLSDDTGWSITLHQGLGTTLETGYRGEPKTVIVGGEQPTFELCLGCTLRALEKGLGRLRSRCRECGGSPHKEVNGHPGEYLVLCANGHVIGNTFNPQAVI